MTGYQVTNYMVRYMKIHVMYSVLVYGKFQYPVISSWRCWILQLLLYFLKEVT